MNRLIIKLLLFFLAVMWAAGATAQTINTTAGTVTSCPGEILVPVNVTNCNGVGAISLVLNYSSAHLTYLGYTSLNPALTSGLLIINSTGNKVVVSWANTAAANIGTGTLVTFRFTATSGSSNLNWDTQTPGNCEYSDLSGTILPASFTNGTATIHYIPVITGHPVDRSILVGQNTNFSVTATGTGLGYQWQVSTNGGGLWNDLVNGGVYSGVTGSVLYLTNVSLAYNGFKYRCRVSGTCPPQVISDTASLTVINPVTTTLPTGSSCPGNIVVPVTVTNFTAIASFSLVFSFDTAVLDYTGYQSVNPLLAGGTSVINMSGNKVFYTWASTTAVTIGNGTILEFLFSTSTGTSALTWDLATPGNCEYVTLGGDPLTSVWINGSQTIHSLPAVVSNPVSKTIAKGQNTTFSASGSGTGVAYRWQISTDGGGLFTDLSNGGNYSNVTGTTLNITSATLAMSGHQYRCRISGTCTPQVFSNPATLTVLPNIITQCGTVATCPGTVTVPVTVTDFIGVGSFSLVLNFNASVLTWTGYQNLHTALAAGSFIANAVSGKVYLTWSHTTAATIPAGGSLIELTFTGVPGSSALSWDTQVNGNCEYSDINGLIIFSTWNNGTATIHSPPAITTHPADKSVYGGGSTSFSVGASGTGISYAWQVSTNNGTSWSPLSNVSPYSGVTTANLTINPAGVAMSGFRYRCNVSGTCTPSVVSDDALLTVTHTAITTAINNISNSCTGNLDIPVNVTNCTDVGAVSLVLQYDTTKLTYDSYYGVHSELSTGILIVNRSGNKIYMSWASTTAANVGNGVLLRYRFKAIPSASTTLSWVTQPAGNCEYTGMNGEVITSFFTNGNISVIANPLMANAGADAGTPYGVPVQLNGVASGGVGPYTYLWTPATGLSNASISNPVANPAVTTTYTFSVTGNNGCVASDPLTVAIIVPPTRDLQNINIPSGTTVCYDATQVITVAGSGTYFTVQNGGSVTMIAGQRITYLPGTTVFSGGYMHGYITTTNQYCFTLPAPEPPEVLSLTETEETPYQQGARWKLFPNPSSGRFTLAMNREEGRSDARVTIFSVRGEKVFRGFMTGLVSQEFDISGTSAGIYFVHVEENDAHEVLKLIVSD